MKFVNWQTARLQQTVRFIAHRLVLNVTSRHSTTCTRAKLLRVLIAADDKRHREFVVRRVREPAAARQHRRRLRLG